MTFARMSTASLQCVPTSTTKIFATVASMSNDGLVPLCRFFGEVSNVT